MSKSIQIKRIRDLKVALKDMEPYVKNPDFLRRGKRFGNFNMLPRELWANILFCAFLKEYNIDATIAEGGDGIILNKNTKDWILTEHVSAMDVPSEVGSLKNEDRILWAIDHKIKKGPKYARRKTLLVFFEGAEKWYPNKIGRHITGRHNFDAVYGVGFLERNDNGYHYSISEFKEEYSPTWRVEINSDFMDWKVYRMQ